LKRRGFSRAVSAAQSTGHLQAAEKLIRRGKKRQGTTSVVPKKPKK
jgi:hypothetical protein